MQEVDAAAVLTDYSQVDAGVSCGRVQEVDAAAVESLVGRPQSADPERGRPSLGHKPYPAEVHTRRRPVRATTGPTAAGVIPAYRTINGN